MVKAEDEGDATVACRVQPGSTVYADEALHWDALHARFEAKRINHDFAFSNDGARTNQAESYFSRLRRAEFGQHHRSSGDYLGFHASEMAWRENLRRKDNDNGTQYQRKRIRVRAGSLRLTLHAGSIGTQTQGQRANGMSESNEAAPISLIEDADTGARFLLYVGKNGVEAELRFDVDQPWFTQGQLAQIFGVDIRTANAHVTKFLSEGELDGATIRKFRIVRQEGSRKVEREIEHYGLDVAFYVGYRVNSRQGALFRRWATDILIRFATKGFVIDASRLKAPADQDRIAELREIIRDIRSSEANIYAELRRICAMCQDYDPASDEARDFYVKMQAKLFWAVTSGTPSMIVISRANAETPNMGLRHWQKTDIRQSDALVAKNYLAELELHELNRLTTILLDIFEDQVSIGKLTLMIEASQLLDKQLRNLNRSVLAHGGRVSHAAAEAHAKAEYGKFDTHRRAQRVLEQREELAQLKRVDASLRKAKKP